MTDIVSPPVITAMPPAPQPTDTPSDFKAKAFASVAAQAAFVPQANALGANMFQNATAAGESAAAAAASAATAVAQAGNAAAARAASEAARDTAIIQADNASTARQAAEEARGAATGAAQAAARDAAAVAQGLGTISGGPVASINGLKGVVTIPIPAVADLGNADLSSAVNAGFYRFGSPVAGAPVGVSNGQLLVLRGPDGTATLAQLAIGSNGLVHARGMAGLPGNASASPWRRMAMLNEPSQLTDGVMDLSKGMRFHLGINGSTVALSFVNVPPESASVLLEISFMIGGGFTLPAGSVWANGTIPTIVTGKRHLLYFEKCFVGNVGWYVSALTGFAA
ncbi:hypothetical protein C8247_14390 [Paracidovorax avenae]|uniref:hypothetical protein n=1 Tax=Paracidovorax avenae TaxID=80867 RepID=UPI000D1712D8|nr:hypothetical protein [Paracidovorax avenae]AVS71502.1 hypothetical protein C8247_14390 [Paracidovorax avenae]